MKLAADEDDNDSDDDQDDDDDDFKDEGAEAISPVKKLAQNIPAKNAQKSNQNLKKRESTTPRWKDQNPSKRVGLGTESW